MNDSSISRAKDNPGVVADPPMIYLAALGLGLLLDRAVPWQASLGWLGQPLRHAVGGACLLAGLAVVATAFRQFARAGTNLPTHRPTTALVVDGLYRWSRNPIYVALTLAYLGLALVLASPWTVALLPAVLAVMRYGVVGREERYLEAKFGDAYRAYKASVRRWI